MGIPLSSIDKELCMNFIKKLSDVLDAIVSFISGFLMAVLTIITLSGVVFRYVLGNPISWVYEFTIVSFAWMIFLGTAMAFKKNEHISLAFVVSNHASQSAILLERGYLCDLYHISSNSIYTWV